MTIRLKYLYLLFSFQFLSLSFSAQTPERPIASANSQFFNGNIYIFGITNRDNKSILLIYKLNNKAEASDSLLAENGKSKADDFLQLSSDTLHDFLNIYLQKKVAGNSADNKKSITIYRINKAFKIIAVIENVDVARLNSISAFENEIYYFKKNVFTIKSINDSSGKQFYLNKYKLKNDLDKFEYDQAWQFPFERKHIHCVHIAYADSSTILLYVVIITGSKRGEWILKINANSGLLKRATKLNIMGDYSYYSFGKIIYDTALKQIFVTGQKFLETDFNQQENKLKLCGKAFVNIYLAQIDSVGDCISKESFKIPVNEIKSAVNKTPTNYLIRANNFSLNNIGEFIIETEIYKGYQNKLCYNYCNSLILKIIKNEDHLTLEKAIITAHPMVEKFYINNDALDMNGKLCVDSISEFEKLYYKSITFNVKSYFKMDDSNNPLWLLRKSDSKNGKQNYSFLAPVNKIYKLSLIQEISNSENPSLLHLNKNQFLITKQTLPDRFFIQLYNW